MYQTITLTEQQYQSGVMQANQRDYQSQQLGHSNARGLKGQNDFSLMGSVAEVAASLFGSIDFKISVNAWNDPDLITKSGKKVDVKASKQAEYLYIAPRHLHPSWFYLAVQQLDDYTYAFLGWIEGKDVFQYPLKDIKNRNSAVYCIPTAALNTRFN